MKTKFPCRSEDEFEKWEAEIKKYKDQSGETIAESILIATATNGLQDTRLLEHMQLNSAQLDSYEKLREVISNYYSSRKNWSGLAPMDLAALGGGGSPIAPP